MPKASRQARQIVRTDGLPTIRTLALTMMPATDMMVITSTWTNTSITSVKVFNEATRMATMAAASMEVTPTVAITSWEKS